LFSATSFLLLTLYYLYFVCFVACANFWVPRDGGYGTSTYTLSVSGGELCGVTSESCWTGCLGWPHSRQQRGRVLTLLSYYYYSTPPLLCYNHNADRRSSPPTTTALGGAKRDTTFSFPLAMRRTWRDQSVSRRGWPESQSQPDGVSHTDSALKSPPLLPEIGVYARCQWYTVAVPAVTSKEAAAG
jgi:hypothetical protein